MRRTHGSAARKMLTRTASVVLFGYGPMMDRMEHRMTPNETRLRFGYTTTEKWLLTCYPYNGTVANVYGPFDSRDEALDYYRAYAEGYQYVVSSMQQVETRK
jgi:hypothetical protein